MQRTPQNAARRGFTLTELLVVMVIIGIMAAMGIPSLERAIEQSRADVAAANLRAIWAAQRLYWLEYHAYTDNLSQHNPLQSNSLVDLGLLDAAITASASSYSYTVAFPTSDPGGLQSFTATATRVGSSQWSGCFTIDQTGTIPDSNVISAAGQADIKPGFQ
jgi:prepilin-type N-terminal cleavage/methylation domain-containing protein